MKTTNSLSSVSWLCSLVLAISLPVRAIPLDQSNPASVKAALSTIAYSLMSTYQGNQTGQTPGLLPYLNVNNNQRYYWWETGAMFGTMVDYWYYTGDTTYNGELIQGMQWQAGPGADFEPQNQTSDLGNDDQAFWAFTTMAAAEYNFPNPPSTDPSWLEISQAVFNRQAWRWDKSVCNGGLHWQVFPLNQGYNYKNAGSNGCFFQLAARLAKYTGNATYGDWADKTWDWMEAIGLINTTDWAVADGSYTDTNCTTFQPYVWSYNSAILVYGAAAMWNFTGNDIWRTRVTNLIGGMKIFFPNNVMFEYECETNNICNNDQQSFKAYTARFLAATTLVAPWAKALVQTWLSTSAQHAAAACTGGTSGTACGLNWRNGSYDGVTGVGEEMAALEVIGAQFMYTKKGPLTGKTGGTSKSNPSAGSTAPLVYPGYITRPITAGDRAGAGILSVLFGVGSMALSAWIMI